MKVIFRKFFKFFTQGPQKRRRQNPAVCHNHNKIGRKAAESFLCLAIPQCGRLVDRDAVPYRQLLNGRRSQYLFAAYRLICPGKHTHNRVTGIQQCLEAGRCNIRRAHKQDAHQSSSPSG